MRSPWPLHIAAVHSAEQMLSVGLTAVFHVLLCVHPGRCILLPCTVQSRCCLLVSQQNTWWSLLSRVPCSRLWCLQAGNLCLHQCWLASLELPCVAAGLQLDALVDVQAKVLSVLHHDTAAISAVRCLKLFLERLGCAFGEGDEAEVSTAWPLSASGSYLWHTVGGAGQCPRRCWGLSPSGDHLSPQSLSRC